MLCNTARSEKAKLNFDCLWLSVIICVVHMASNQRVWQDGDVSVNRDQSHGEGSKAIGYGFSHSLENVAGCRHEPNGLRTHSSRKTQSCWWLGVFWPMFDKDIKVMMMLDLCLAQRIIAAVTAVLIYSLALHFTYWYHHTNIVQIKCDVHYWIELCFNYIPHSNCLQS